VLAHVILNNRRLEIPKDGPEVFPTPHMQVDSRALTTLGEGRGIRDPDRDLSIALPIHMGLIPQRSREPQKLLDEDLVPAAVRKQIHAARF
jgi:hypothetical protein